MMNTANSTQETVVEAIRPDERVTTIVAPNGCVIASTSGSSSIFAAIKAAAKDWDWD